MTTQETTKPGPCVECGGVVELRRTPAVDYPVAHCIECGQGYCDGENYEPNYCTGKHCNGWPWTDEGAPVVEASAKSTPAEIADKSLKMAKLIGGRVKAELPNGRILWAWPHSDKGSMTEIIDRRMGRPTTHYPDGQEIRVEVVMDPFTGEQSVRKLEPPEPDDSDAPDYDFEHATITKKFGRNHFVCSCGELNPAYHSATCVRCDRLWGRDGDVMRPVDGGPTDDSDDPPTTRYPDNPWNEPKLVGPLKKLVEEGDQLPDDRVVVPDREGVREWAEENGHSVREVGPQPDADVMGFLHSRYGDKPTHEIGKHPLGGGVESYVVQVGALEYAFSREFDGEVWDYIVLGGGYANVQSARRFSELSDACNAADEAARALLDETGDRLGDDDG